MSFPHAAVLWLLVGLLGTSGVAQVSSAPKNSRQKPEDKLQQHYDAARTFQLSGDQQRAAAEYKAFLAGALRTSAKASAELGELDKAESLFAQALLIAPDDPDTRVDHVQLLFQQDKLAEARVEAEKILGASPENSRAHLLLGQVLFAQKDYKAAREQLEAAVGAAPTFDSAYLLGITYIQLNDFVRARLVFDDIVRSFGDTAQIRMMFGMAYKQGGWEALDQAIQELKKALVKDNRAKRAHFLIALAYIDRDGESAFLQAAAELQSELKINPDDARSHYLLGYIALKQHDLKAAETELLRAAQLDPKNPDPLIYLGQVYSDTERDAEAEAALRKAISLAGNASPTDYLIGRAHYILGRLILKKGNKEEGEKELLLSQQLRDKLNRPDLVRDSRSKADPELASVAEEPATGRAAKPPAVPQEAAAGIRAYVDQLKPAIADAYNNLGVIEAGAKEFKTAASYFRLAGEWNPSLETLDRNWGMAAFYAADYQDAVRPLGRQLQNQPDDVRVRAALGLSLFMVQQFKGAVEVLKPIESQVDGDPGLAYAYAVSLLKIGSYDEGIRRLKSMDASTTKSAELHMLLGSAYADQKEYETAIGEYRKSLAIDPNQAQTHYLAGLALIRSGRPQEAIEDLRTALKLDPSDASAKYHLAFALIQAQQKDEAKKLLLEVIEQDPKRPDAFYELGKLQLEQGDTKSAVANLEAGTRLNPEAEYIHYQLAMAYRREARTEDAEREIKLYQELKNHQRGRGDAQPTN